MSEETKYQKLKGDSQLCYHNNRGVEKCEAGEFDEGIAEFNQAIQLSPKLSVPYFICFQISPILFYTVMLRPYSEYFTRP